MILRWNCFSFSLYTLHFTESVVVRVNEFLNTICKAMLIYSILDQGSIIYQTPCPSRESKMLNSFGTWAQAGARANSCFVTILQRLALTLPVLLDPLRHHVREGSLIP